MTDHPNAEDRANKAEREAAYWRERCGLLEVAQERFLGWLKNEAFMFGCVAEDIRRWSGGSGPSQSASEAKPVHDMAEQGFRAESGVQGHSTGYSGDNAAPGGGK